MRIAGLRTRWRDWLAKAIFAGAVFLLPVENVFAIADLSTSSASFASIDGTRSYMDSAGTWNSITNTEVTNTTGDRFTISVSNTGADPAFDVGITVTLPTGFRLPDITAPISNPITVTSPTGCNINSGATNFTGLNATQSGSTVNFNIPNNREFTNGCTYNFTVGLTTRNSAPFPATGLNNIVFNIDYDDGGPQLLEQVTQPIQVNTAAIALTKTAITTSAANGNPVDFLVVIRNVGTGGIFNNRLTDTLSANLTGLTFTSVIAYDSLNNVVALPSTFIAPNQYRFPYIPPNVRFEVGVRATATVNPADTTCPDMTNDATVVARTGISSSDFATVDFNLANSLLLTHDLLNSYCELCGIGEVRVTAQNTGGISLVDIDITENLGTSGLTYVNNSTTISINGGPAIAAANPIVGGANGQLLTWTPAQIPQLAQLDSPFAVPAPPNPISVQIRYQVQRAPAFNEEGLITAIRNIEATADYALICNGIPQNASSGIDVLPIRQPVPQVVKEARNTDAGQGAGAYAPIVYTHINDDIIWRVNVQNTGLANMEDLLMDDTIGGNFDINWVCSNEGAAANAATVWPINPAAPPAGCVSAGGGSARTSVLNFAVDDPFGNPANDENTTFIDVPSTGNAYIYYVGRVLGGCSNHTNTANIEWGCEADSPPEGGIIATADGVPFTNTGAADLSAQVVGGLNMAVAVTGSNVNQPVGSKGLVTITITNNTGATVRLWDNNPATISLRDVLPVQYVMDTTFTPTAVMVPAYGANYAGMVDSILHTNPQVNPLANTAPEFRLFSSTVNNDPNLTGATYDHMIRNGDQLTVQFGIVLIDPSRYDLVANLDVAPEITGDGTDPNSVFTVANSATVFFRNICTPVATNNTTVNGNYPANLEDLDVSISDALFILTNDPGTPLALNVDLTNNGGHDADDYYLYVSFGQTMVVQTAAAGCVATTNPPVHPVFLTTHPTWNYPDAIPGPLNGDPEPASIYVCNRGVLAPGATQRFTFDVIKSAAQPAIDADDLTFRADVIGEITLSDGTSLTFPAPASIVNTTPNQQLANNYSLDAIRSRVLGFNLSKNAWYCTESGTAEPPAPTQLSDIVPPYPLPAELNTQIGEDCHYFIESGGWFGFLTPGFTLIAVENVQVIDDLPNGQGFIPFDAVNNFDYNNTGNIILNGVDGGAASTPLGESDIVWEFNVTGSGIVVKDEFFRVNVKTRLLNDPVDSSAAPNVHAAPSTDIARTNFDAIFNSVSGDVTINVSDAAAIPGYPAQAIRQENLTVIEPNLTVVKRVCNETLYGVGAACSNFVPLADDGDTQDSYVFRIEITNEAISGGVTRAPAYDVTAIDTLDALDQMLIVSTGSNAVDPFLSDGLDNDGDGIVDEADENSGIGGDGIDNDNDGLIDGADPSERIISDNVLENAIPAVITTAYTHSTALQRIDPGTTVTFYYRVNPADSISPLQTMTNTVYAGYDSLDGDFGSQNAPQLDNFETVQTSGRARLYTTPSTTASVRILPLQTQPKTIIQSSNTPLTGSPQDVVVGEEIEYRLQAQIPVANLRNFVIRDELPPGIRCVDGQTINLNAAPYNAAGFVPGGSFAATCTSTGTNDVVQWNFGNQQLTTATGNNLFDFNATFIARVENSATTQDGCNIRNGGSTGAAAVPAPAACSTDVTLARLTYVDEASNTVTLNYASADLVVREPVIAVTKSFAPVTQADADDLLTVTVTATNNGSTTAYNLEVLDDLLTSTTNLHYVPASTGGINPPDVVTSLGGDNDRPIFSWLPANPDFAIAPGNTISFTFQVRPDVGVQPHEILDNTIEARWTSLPDANALPDIDTGAARTLAVDGDVLGMRNGRLTGVVPVTANPPNDYFTSATDSVVVPELTISKTDMNPAVVPAIGEHKQFQIVISLPEGVTNGVTITDDLNATGLSYILENDATYDITYTFQDIETINGDAPSEAAFVAGVANPNDGFPADESSGIITWNIGTVDTDSENDSVPGTLNPQIIINYYARINNDVNTDAGDTLQNGATLNYTNGEDSSIEVRTDNTNAITVVEPVLTASKNWTNETAGKAQGDAPDAGDILEYVVTINNTGTATAFDINIVDTIPVSVLRDVSYIPTATINAVPVAGFEAVPLNTPSGPLIWGRGNTTTLPGGDETLDLPAGGTLILTYRVLVQDSVEANQVISNSVVVDWTSLNGVDPLERFGTGGATCTIVAPDDYCVGPVVATATVPNIYNVTKVYNSDSWLPANDAQLRVGDTVQYTITLSMQEATTDNIILIDTLPNGLEFVSVNSVNGDVAAPYSAAAPFSHADIAAPVVTTGTGNNTITWTIGTVTNAGDNNAANDDFIIVYTAQVVNDELPIPQNASTVLLNTASVNYEDVSTAIINIVDSESITAQQPVIALADISKVRRSGILSGSPVVTGDTLTNPLAEVMDFELSACNSGNAPAYDLIVDDILHVNMNETSIRSPGDLANAGTPPVVLLNGAVAAAGTDYIYTPPAGPGGTMRFVFNSATNPLQPGQCAVIRYDIDNNSIGINQSWDNSFQVNEYHSLHSTDINVAERETYDTVVGPVLFNMHTIAPIYPPQKTLISPTAPYEVTIGELVTYQILVPDTAMSGALFDVALTDNMSPALTFVSATLDTSAANAYSGAIDTTGTSANQVRIGIAQLPGGQQATINVVARVDNNSTAQNTLPPFNNTVNYTFAATSGGSPIIGGGDVTDPLTNVIIVEPEVTLQTKTVANVTNPGNPPDAGDILRYTLTMAASSGAEFADAFDVSVIDTLSLGLVYSGNPTVTNSGPYTNIIGAPSTAGDGVSTQQVMTWALPGSNIDIQEGGSITITYDVLVLDSVLANQDLTNSALVQWTSIDGADINERDGSGGVNDYVSGPLTATVTTPNNNTILKNRVSDTYNAADANIRVGDIVRYQIDLQLQEGTHNNVIVTDVIPQGVVFEGIASINADTAAPYSAAGPFSYTDVPAGNITIAGDPATGSTTLTINLGNITNAGDNDTLNDSLSIVYYARILNNDVHPQVNNIALSNLASYSYDTATVSSTTITDSVTLNLLQPNLSVTKTSQQYGNGDTVLEAGEQVRYTVTITNNGTAPAYDTVLRDVIPYGMRQAGVTTFSIESPIGNTLANFAPSYDPVTGEAIWDFDTGAAELYAIAPGQSLQIAYDVFADAGLGAGVTLTNSAQVQVYYSFDDDAVPVDGTVTGAREDYGPSNIATVTLTTPAPNPLDKQNPVPATATIGVPFTYTITVPDVPQATALYDVRILDNIGSLSPGVDLIFVDVQKVSVPGTWVPVNTGTPTDLIIEDTVNGIDIPAGEQAVIAVTVVLQNTSNNVAGDTFTNYAEFTFNAVDGDNGTQGIGGGDTTTPITVIEPDAVTLQKSGPAAIGYGTPETFSIDVHNTSLTTVYDLTVTDHLPDPVPGGMCDTPPANFTAEIRDNGGVTQRVLTVGTDFSTAFTTGTNLPNAIVPTTCTLTITMQSDAARIEPDWHLVMGYDASLDVDNFNNTSLYNYAAATQWFSGNTPAGVAEGEIRTYYEVFDPADPGTPALLDHQDRYATVVASPDLVIIKEVYNVTQNSTVRQAEPNDTLRYTITITNIGPVAANNFTLTDEPDALNPPPGYFTSPGSITNVVSPVPYTIDNAGGINGNGLLTVPNLTLNPAESLTISFEITLRNVIDAGTIVFNQAQVALTGFTSLLSDAADPLLPGAADPTEVRIGSFPAFQLEKTSQDITGDPAVLLTGEVLRYTITAKNIGVENAINTVLRDQIPANTTYVTNSTRLNGNPVPDIASGISPLQDGMLINAPENTSPGFMRADVSATTANMATVSFDVIINANVVNGAVISNQAFVTGEGAGSGPFPESPSDDPSTELMNDPTQDVVGNMPVLDAQKTVSIYTDGGTPDVVDQNDVLEYEISISNSGAVAANAVTLIDPIPLNAVYVADSVVMVDPVTSATTAIPDTTLVSISPLTIRINSSDLPVHNQLLNDAQMTAGESAIVRFRVRVTAASGVVSNQGAITSAELPDEATDADGNDENGDQPTVVTIGEDSELLITKSVFVVGGGVAQAGGELEYVILVQNNGSVDATNVILTDAIPASVNYVAGSARLNGSTVFNGGAVIEPGANLTVDYQTALGALEPGDSFSVSFRAIIDSAIDITTQQTITNNVDVTWTENPNPAVASVSVDVGGAPGVANLSGKVWHDSNLDLVDDSNERVLEGWEVQIYFGSGTANPGDYLDSVYTNALGEYSIQGLIPNNGDLKEYALRFVGPGAGTNTASLGNTDSIYAPGPQQVINIDNLTFGSHIPRVNLPIQPNGVVYDSVVRTGVAGVRLELINGSGNVVPASCFDNPSERNQQNQQTLVYGYYKFELNFSQAECNSGDDYTIRVYPPSGYYDNDNNLTTDMVSQIIPPALALTDPGYDVPGCPNDALPSGQCEVQTSEYAPATSEAPRSPTTNYYLKLNLVDVPSDDQIYNNHIPVDPELNDALAISKTSALLNVTRSQLVPYTITIVNTVGAPVYDVDLIDRFPAGFKYVENSARVYVNGTRVEDPALSVNVENIEPNQDVVNLRLIWPNMIVNNNQTITIKMLLVVGAGVGEGEYVNRVQAINNRTNGAASGEANATVRVVPDPTFDCSDVIGKVFDDKNLNGYQDEGEPGLAGARVVTAQGLQITADEYGRFHIACAVVPNPDRGSNFIVKLDERSLPTGYRVTTENPRVQRATRGKMLKYNFGAAIHRVVRLDMADAVFKPGTTEMRLQWKPRLDLLISELAKDPSVLRLSYLADNESEGLVKERIQAVKDVISERWQSLNCCYKLMIESEVFWRKGGPPDKKVFD